MSDVTANAATDRSPARLAVFLSGGGRSLTNLMRAIARGELAARIVLAVASKECPGAQQARAAGMPTLIMPGEIAAAELEGVLRKHDAQWVVLAGYLKKLAIPRGFEGRVVNIHPALLPRFGGTGMYGRRVHEAVLAAGARESGCTVHLCDDLYDHGPIVLQDKVEVVPGDTPDTLGARVFEAECRAYPRALAMLIDGSWRAKA
ncbi:MAG: phosphoribosylglycinamide formyltransferase [Planctomycetota bacterium]